MCEGKKGGAMQSPNRNRVRDDKSGSIAKRKLFVFLSEGNPSGFEGGLQGPREIFRVRGRSSGFAILAFITVMALKKVVSIKLTSLTKQYIEIKYIIK